LRVRIEAAKAAISFERPRLRNVAMTTRSLDEMTDEDVLELETSLTDSSLPPELLALVPKVMKVRKRAANIHLAALTLNERHPALRDWPRRHSSRLR
jgi:hypothetical protein